MTRRALNPEGNPTNSTPHLCWVIGVIILLVLAAFLILKPRPSGPKLNNGPTPSQSGPQ